MISAEYGTDARDLAEDAVRVDRRLAAEHVRARVPLLMSTRWRNGSRSTRTISATSERCTTRAELSRTARRPLVLLLERLEAQELQAQHEVVGGELDVARPRRASWSRTIRASRSRPATGACTAHWIG